MKHRMTGKCHLLTFVQFVDGYNIIDQFLFMKEMKTSARGELIFDVALLILSSHVMEFHGMTVLVSVLMGL